MTLTSSSSIVAEPDDVSIGCVYTVDEDQADDPEANWHGVLTAFEIGQRYPEFAQLFTGDGAESLTYVHELWRVRIEPVLS